MSDTVAVSLWPTVAEPETVTVPVASLLSAERAVTACPVKATAALPARSLIGVADWGAYSTVTPVVLVRIPRASMSLTVAPSIATERTAGSTVPPILIVNPPEPAGTEAGSSSSVHVSTSSGPSATAPSAPAFTAGRTPSTVRSRWRGNESWRRSTVPLFATVAMVPPPSARVLRLITMPSVSRSPWATVYAKRCTVPAA